MDALWEVGSERSGQDWSRYAFILALLGSCLLPAYLCAGLGAPSRTANAGASAGILKLLLPSAGKAAAISLVATVLCQGAAVTVAYLFLRRRMPGGTWLWPALSALLLLPLVADLLPLAGPWQATSAWGLLAAGLGFALIFSIYVLHNAMVAIPPDLLAAAELEGASFWQQMTQVVLPLCGPVLGILAMLTFLNAWDDLLAPLIVLRNPGLGTAAGLSGPGGEYWRHGARIVAAFFIATPPALITILFTFRLFLRSLRGGRQLAV